MGINPNLMKTQKLIRTLDGILVAGSRDKHWRISSGLMARKAANNARCMADWLCGNAVHVFREEVIDAA
jgi:hypothetical protein